MRRVGQRPAVADLAVLPSARTVDPPWLPRHTHDADCLYFVLKGELRMGSKVMKAGDGMFIPAGRPYTYRAGPGGVEVLEFRASTSFDMKTLDQDVPKWAAFVAGAAQMREAWEQTRPGPYLAED